MKGRWVLLVGWPMWLAPLYAIGLTMFSGPVQVDFSFQGAVAVRYVGLFIWLAASLLATLILLTVREPKWDRIAVSLAASFLGALVVWGIIAHTK